MTAFQATIANVPEARPAAPATSSVSVRTWLAVIGATLGAFMAVLNIQIVNASLADIQGAIGAGIDDGGWISLKLAATQMSSGTNIVSAVPACAY